MEPLFSVPQAAAQLTVSPASVWRYLALEQLERIKISSRCTRIPERSIQAFLQTRSTPTYREASPVFETLMHLLSGSKTDDAHTNSVCQSGDGPEGDAECIEPGTVRVGSDEDGQPVRFCAEHAAELKQATEAAGFEYRNADNAKGGLEDPADEV